jgi:NAD(P)-dependent dehydrogenase (short-subunit alcohol dehydrogenase family)
MKTALIIGSSGTIGSAVFRAFKDAGYETEGVSRSTSPGMDIDQPDSVRQFMADAKNYEAIVCAAGNASFGALDKLKEEDFRLSFNSKLAGQIRIVQYGLQHLNKNGTILLTGGMFAFDPWPETSVLAAVNAGLEGFVRAIAKEVTDGRKVRIIHPPLVAETAKMIGTDPSPWPDAAIVAGAYLNGVENGEGEAILYVNGYTPKAPETY